MGVLILIYGCPDFAPLKLSDWGVWILSHVDLRATARVRVCRELLLETIEKQRPLTQGEKSRYA